MKILWIGGWAISIKHMQTIVETVFPQYNHSYVHPHKNYLECIEKENHDIIVGYSLGATLLLNKTHLFKNSKKYLIAPFLNIEGAIKVNNIQLKFLLKKLKTDPLHTINDFYKRAQLSMPEATFLPYPLDDLYWGIETIMQPQEYVADDSNQFILIGQNDPLINPKFFQKNFNQITILAGVKHNFEAYTAQLSF